MKYVLMSVVIIFLFVRNDDDDNGDNNDDDNDDDDDDDDGENSCWVVSRRQTSWQSIRWRRSLDFSDQASWKYSLGQFYKLTADIDIFMKLNQI